MTVFVRLVVAQLAIMTNGAAGTYASRAVRPSGWRIVYSVSNLQPCSLGTADWPNSFSANYYFRLVYIPGLFNHSLKGFITQKQRGCIYSEKKISYYCMSFLGTMSRPIPTALCSASTGHPLPPQQLQQPFQVTEDQKSPYGRGTHDVRPYVHLSLFLGTGYRYWYIKAPNYSPRQDSKHSNRIFSNTTSPHTLKMHYLFYLSLTLSSASLALADCCRVGPCLPDPGLSCIQKCGDGTDGTPCCGVGGCNIFCCNCDGGKLPGLYSHIILLSQSLLFETLHTYYPTKIGCRGAGTTKKRDALSGNDSTADDDEVFAVADVDSSGNVTMAEYMGYMSPGPNMGLYIDRFNKYVVPLADVGC